ncbi:transmembrane protein, putative (macronuclear) [Tetrahymena thermophila SB210]|uniref:Transmembrane protein, putative n=1 Tax=Tetrahymena thermophila (strain SB210) TaxID=312017 RepID=I7LTM4_TETTS|nr:transmembrane protein, putative [Tetrahymena thermophila SB210]EAR85513.2 transmembrane protein, putative [Tetrahymena thermophila SB210]|eukprot:XP_001033176.2 transmembrane protein, putative [Tetrahymena thermophila SB210]
MINKINIFSLRFKNQKRQNEYVLDSCIEKQVYLVMLFFFSIAFVLIQVSQGNPDYKIYFVPPLFIVSFFSCRFFKKHSDYVDCFVNVLQMFLITEVVQKNENENKDRVIYFFLGQFAIILFFVQRGNNFLLNLITLVCTYFVVYLYISNAPTFDLMGLAFAILVVGQNYAYAFFKRQSYLHKSYFKEILQLDFPSNIFLTQYDKVTCRLVLQDCNKLAQKRFKLDQGDQEGFSEFLKRIKVQQRRKSRSYIENNNNVLQKEANLKEYLITKYIRLNQEFNQYKKTNCMRMFNCFKKSQLYESNLQNFIHGIDKTGLDQINNFERNVLNNENLFGYYYKKQDDQTYSKSFKIHLQLIDFYKEPSIAIFFEDETVQDDLIDVKLKKKKQKQLVISALNQVRQKISSLLVLFKDHTDNYILKQTKQLSILLLNQTFNLFDYIYLKEKKKLLQKQQQIQIQNADESSYKDQYQTQNKYQLILNLSEFPLKSLLNELRSVNPSIEILFSDFGDDTKSEINNQQQNNQGNEQDFVIFNDYKRVLQVLLSLTFQENIQLIIRLFKENLYSGIEFIFNYGSQEQNEKITEQNFQDTAQNQNINQGLDLCLNKNQTDKRLKEIDLYVIKIIVRDIGPNSLFIDKLNNQVSFKIFSDIRVLQFDDEAKIAKSSQHNINIKKEKQNNITKNSSFKSIAQLSIHNSSFCKTEVKQNSEYPQLILSPPYKNLQNNQQTAQSPRFSFKSDLKGQFMQNARRSAYSRTLPPSQININNSEIQDQNNIQKLILKEKNDCETFLQSNQNIIQQNDVNIEPAKENGKNSPQGFSNNYFVTKMDEISQYTYDEGEDLPEIKMTKYLPNS